jgi:NMD protein affecting ribosome stability and mRNA decay
MHGKSSNDIYRQFRDLPYKEPVRNIYMLDTKRYLPAKCTGCGAVYQGGRWQWAEQRPRQTNKEICPTCQRVANNIPAGILTLSGEYFKQHRDEILRLVNQIVFKKESKNPTERIIAIDTMENGDSKITFTDGRLPHGVGEEIKKVYEGNLSVHYPSSIEVVNAMWIR